MDGRIVIVETKGLVDLNVEPKIRRLFQWTEDLNAMQSDVRYDFVYVDQDGFKVYSPKSFEHLLTIFREYKV